YRFLPLTEGPDAVPAGPEQPSADPAVPLGPAGGDGPVDERCPVRPATGGAPLETDTWRLALRDGDGLPVGLVHRPTGRDLLDPTAPYPLGQLVRLAAAGTAAGPHDRQRIDQLDSRYHPTRTELAEQVPTVRLVGARRTPEGLRVRWRGTGAGLRDLHLDLLLGDAGIAELEVTLDPLPGIAMASLSIAFPFRVDRPAVHYDRQLGWVQPVTDHGPGAANEWLTCQSAVCLTAANGPGVLWATPDAPLFSCGDLVRGRWPDRFGVRTGHLYSYVMNNFWPCNTPPEQPGPARFRYAFTPVGAFDPVTAYRFGRQARLGGLSSEVSPLDRFPAGAPAAHRTGTVLELAVPAQASVSLTGTDRQGELSALVTNLTPERREVTFRPPPGYRPADRAAGADGLVTVALGRYGLTEVTLHRLIEERA
ncbi:hypothetical protein ACFFWC_19025, partial [Plantactinospora siamensis]